MKKYVIEYDLYDDILALLGHEIPHDNYDNVNSIVVELTTEEYEALVGAGIKIIPNTVGRLLYAPANIAAIGAPDPASPINDFWNITNAHLAGFDGTGVSIALLDTGANASALLCTPTLIRQDYTGTGVQDDNNHGGKECNIIGQVNSATAPNGPIAYGGIAKGCQLYSMKVFPGGAAEMIAAISWCIAHGIHVINVSLDILDGTTSAINAAMAAGIIVVCASGNNVDNYIAHPANVPGVICVSGVEYNNASVSFGSYLADPVGTAQVVVTTYDGGSAETFVGGTSQAACMLSALMAVYKQKYPSLTTAKAINLLRRRALPMDGYTYDINCKTKGVLLDLHTGAGFVAPLN